MAIFQGGNKNGGMFFPNGYQGWAFRQWASPPMAPRHVSVRSLGQDSVRLRLRVKGFCHPQGLDFNSTRS